jgi:hypothetical protein
MALKHTWGVGLRWPRVCNCSQLQLLHSIRWTALHRDPRCVQAADFDLDACSAWWKSRLVPWLLGAVKMHATVVLVADA